MTEPPAGRRPDQRLDMHQKLVLALFIMAMLFLVEIWPHVAPGGRPRPSDFEIFRMVGQLFWQGNVADAYDFERFRQIQFEMHGTREMLLFGYPPPYILFIAPLGLVAKGVDYLLFVGPALILYLWCLVRLSGHRASLAVLLALLPCYVTLITGQNGFLTGALVGLACVALQSGRAIAGIPLGLMIIKPQLALGIGLFVLARGNFRVLGVAAITALGSAALATMVLGAGIWPAFLAGLAEQSALLAKGFFPFHRMQSPFALANSLGQTGAAAWGMHVAAAVAAGAATVLAARRLPAGTAMGLAVLASPLLSPYMFDYDLTLVAVGIALLLGSTAPTSRWDAVIRWAAPACLLAASINGLVQISLNDSMMPANWPPAYGALLMLVLFWVAALPLLRQGARSQ